MMGGYGVSEDNYIMNTPGTTPQDLQQKMMRDYQDGVNEHLAHTAVADFFGELHTFFPKGIVGKFRFSGKNNHFTRMELLRKLYEHLLK